MKYSYKIVSVSTLIILITGCSDFVDSFSPQPKQKLLKHPNGSIVMRCDGGVIALGDRAENFWKKNNLPKGTTEFVCVDGKAYLPSQEPRR